VSGFPGRRPLPCVRRERDSGQLYVQCTDSQARTGSWSSQEPGREGRLPREVYRELSHPPGARDLR
jgi:hypothetical protein